MELSYLDAYAHENKEEGGSEGEEKKWHNKVSRLGEEISTNLV